MRWGDGVVKLALRSARRRGWMGAHGRHRDTTGWQIKDALTKRKSSNLLFCCPINADVAQGSLRRGKRDGEAVHTGTGWLVYAVPQSAAFWFWRSQR